MENIESIIFSSFKFSDSLKYQKENFLSLDSDFMNVLRFCSRTLNRLKDIQDRRKLIHRHITDSEKSISFSSYYTIHGILIAKQKSDKGELYSDHMWYSLFNEKKEENNEYEKQLVKLYKKATKKIFTNYIEDNNYLNEVELIFLLPIVKLHHSTLYDREFKKLIENDKKLLEILILCITRNYLASGSVIGYQLAKYQLLSGMDVDRIKKRLDNLNKKELNKDERAAINFYFKAYEDGFPEKKYYNFYTLEEIKM